MFDRRIYVNDPVVMQEINRYNCCLNIANIISIAICLGLLIYGIAANTLSKQKLAFNVATSLQLVYLVTWAASLFSLFT